MAIQTRRAEPRGVMVVRSSGKIVGYVYASPSPMEPRIINIDELGVDPEAQRNKYGTKLFQAMVQHIETYRDQVDQIKVTDASEGQRTGNIASSSGFKTSSIMGAFRVYTRNIALSQRYAEVARIVFRALNINPSDSGLTVVNIAQPDLRVRLTDRSAQTIQIPEDQIKVIAPSGESQPSAQFPRAVFYASGIGLDPGLHQDTWKLIAQEGWLIFMADLDKGRRDLRLIPERLQKALGAANPLTAREILDPEDSSLVAIAVLKTAFKPAVVSEEAKLKPDEVHILIAEDEQAIRDILRMVIEFRATQAGIEPSRIHVVDSVKGALDQNDRFRLDFASTDMNMKDPQGRTGIQVAEAARRKNPSARIYLVASVEGNPAQVGEKDNALASGLLNGFVAKPNIIPGVSKAFDQFLKDRVASSGLEEIVRHVTVGWTEIEGNGVVVVTQKVAGSPVFQTIVSALPRELARRVYVQQSGETAVDLVMRVIGDVPTLSSVQMLGADAGLEELFKRSALSVQVFLPGADLEMLLFQIGRMLGVSPAQLKAGMEELRRGEEEISVQA